MKIPHLSSSLILVARNALKPFPTILALERSSRMRSFPKACVFPGGHVDAADEHHDWLSVLPSIQRDVNLNVFSWTLEANCGHVPKAISLRIAAIRETFEECGILLCQRAGNENRRLTLSPVDETFWRKKVHGDAFEFLNLCRAHRCFPNLKALYLLSNWISPCHLAKRFNALFFFTMIDEEMKVIADDIETESVEWKPACEFVENPDTFFAPPQLYEFTRLKGISDVNSLERFAKEVDLDGCHRFVPVLVNTLDGEVYLLPGDGRYEEFFNENAEKAVKLSCDTINFRCNVMHRVEFPKLPNSTIRRNVVVQNVHPAYYHPVAKPSP